MRRSAPRWASQRTSSRATSAAGRGKSSSCWSASPMDARPRLTHALSHPFVHLSLTAADMTVMARRIVDVLVPVALDQPYSYRVPAGLAVAPGDVVRVPLGAREATGAVWAEGVMRPGLDSRLKDIEDKVDVPALRPELRRFVDWVANYTLAPRGMILRMALRMGEHLGTERARVGVRLAGKAPDRMARAPGRLLALLADGLVRPKREAAEQAGVSPGVIDGLV